MRKKNNVTEAFLSFYKIRTSIFGKTRLCATPSVLRMLATTQNQLRLWWAFALLWLPTLLIVLETCIFMLKFIFKTEKNSHLE